MLQHVEEVRVLDLVALQGLLWIELDGPKAGEETLVLVKVFVRLVEHPDIRIVLVVYYFLDLNVNWDIFYILLDVVK